MIIKYLVFSVEDCGHQMDEWENWGTRILSDDSYEMLLFITRMKKFIIIRGIFNYLINHVRAKVEYD